MEAADIIPDFLLRALLIQGEIFMLDGELKSAFYLYSCCFNDSWTGYHDSGLSDS